MAQTKKGDAVWFFQNWNRIGTCAYSHHTVMSCGKRRMTLQSDDGKMLKSFVYAAGYQFVVLDTPDFDPAQHALALGVQFRQEEIDHINRRLAHYGTDDAGYVAAMNKDMARATAHQPEGRKLEDLHAIIVAQLKAA